MASYVLVHGAFHGGWIWKHVADRLRAAGHRVLAPTLTGCGDRFHLLTRDVGLQTHIQDLEQSLEHEDVRDAIIVGHSYGGTVVTATAARSPSRIQQIVYFDAQAPIDGQTASGAMAEGTEDKLTGLSAEDSWLINPLPLDAVGVTAPSDVAWMGPRRHPHPMRTLFERVDVPKGALDGVSKSYIECKRHEGLIALFGVDPLLPFAQRARNEAWRFWELDAGHDAMVTAPEALAAILLNHG